MPGHTAKGNPETRLEDLEQTVERTISEQLNALHAKLEALAKDVELLKAKPPVKAQTNTKEVPQK